MLLHKLVYFCPRGPPQKDFFFPLGSSPQRSKDLGKGNAPLKTVQELLGEVGRVLE